MEGIGETFRALTGHERLLAWQQRLLEQLVVGEVPAALDLPTGLGKTSVMVLWLVALASQMQDGGVPKLPRRLVYVVDRRAVVDQATAEAEKLRQALGGRLSADNEDISPPANGLEWMRAVLGLMQPEDALPVSTLRGKMADNRAWLADPSRPAIIVGTVDMIGSRLLFSGYGVSWRMRPVHAALLAVDSLFVLDESHLAPAFQKLLEQIAAGDARLWPEREVIRPLKVLPLSATGEDKEQAFALTAEDETDAVVAQRLHAGKRLVLREVEVEGKGNALPQALADAAWALAFAPAAEHAGEADREDGEAAGQLQPWLVQRPAGARAVRVIIYADSRVVAQAVAAALEKRAVPGRGRKKEDTRLAHVELFTGARRVYEREQAAQRLQKLGFLAGTAGDADLAQMPAFLVATSAAEVGVDLDADALVGDLVPLERMIQRFGRVNRLGELAESPVEVLIDTAARTKSVKKEAEKAHQARLQAVKRALETLSGDASPAAIANLKRTQPALVEKASTPMSLYPPLEPAHVEAWAMTSLKEHTGRPDIQPWLRGWVEEEPQATIIWRTFLPWREGTAQPVRTEAEDFYRAAPPHLLEMLEAEAGLLADVLVKGAKRWRKRVEQQAREDGQDAEPILNATPALLAFSPSGDLDGWWSLRRLSEEKGGALVPRIAGRLLMAAADLGGLNGQGLLDRDAANAPSTLDAGWDEEVLCSIGYRVRMQAVETPEIASEEDMAQVAEVLLTQQLPSGDWRQEHVLVLRRNADGVPLKWLVVEVLRDAREQAGDLAVARCDYPLDRHLGDVAQEAQALVERLQLPARWQALLREAGCRHDVGKNRLLWQQAANSSATRNLPARQRLRGRLPLEQALAKTKGPFHGRLLGSYRHEFGSLVDALEDDALDGLPDEERDLVLHLIAAHHGRARPLIEAIDPLQPPSRLERVAAEVALRYARLQRRFGPWGLAWLEELLRAADRLASASIGRSTKRPCLEQKESEQLEVVHG